VNRSAERADGDPAPLATDLDEEYLRHALPLTRGQGRGAVGFTLRLLAFALRYLRMLPASRATWARSLDALPAQRHLYFLGTLQQQRALERIVAVDPDACVLDAGALPREVVLRLALAALPVAWRAWRSGSPAMRALLSAKPRLMLMAIAYRAAWREVFARVRPRCLVVASTCSTAA
jgi:hypothetical protein